MNLRKFVASSTSAAMRLVRSALGPDAVILSSRQAGGQCEILAIAGSEADLIAERAASATPAALAPPKAASRATPKPSSPRMSPEPKPAPVRDNAAANANAGAIPLAQWVSAMPASASPAALAASLAARFEAPADSDDSSAGFVARRAATAPAHPAAPAPQAPAAPAPQAPAAPTPAANAEVLGELSRMKGLIEAQGATLAWMQTRHRSPLHAQLMRELLACGFGEVFAREVTDRMPEALGAAAARDWIRTALTRSLRCGDDVAAMVEQGGAFALVGPTGVGKTTSAAKLAARAVVRHGAQGVGLISTDTYRIGAQDQLRIYARILGVPVHVCHDAPSLKGAIDSLAGCRVVLVDTTGLSQRDPRVAAQNALLDECGVQRVLLLNAAMQTEALEETARAYGAREGGAAFTKLDEAVNLGGALETAIRNKLRLRFVTNGQRVPEDLHGANASYLADRALRSRAPLSAAETPAHEAALHV